MTASAPDPTITIGASTTAPIELSLGIEGMTCASCVDRIERFLRKADGVLEANVNLAARVGMTPLTLARSRGYREMEAILTAAGAR